MILPGAPKRTKITVGTQTIDRRPPDQRCIVAAAFAVALGAEPASAASGVNVGA
jgi:hypothetical protein